MNQKKIGNHVKLAAIHLMQTQEAFAGRNKPLRSACSSDLPAGRRPEGWG